VKRDSAPIKVQVNMTLNCGQETINFLGAQGVNSARMTKAISFVENIQTVVSKLAHDNAMIASLMEDIISYDHGVSISMITSLIAHHAGIESTNALTILGTASLLHDIGLVGAQLGLEYEDISKMTEEQKRMYFAHPRVGAELLQKINGTHPLTVQAIAQHHERVGTKAFEPGQDRPKIIAGLAEIIGIANDYYDLIRRYQSDPSAIKPIMEKELFKGFSFDTTEAFLKAFYPSKKPRSYKG
jgi:response regulator RpfG family c-di-GMP phosphodiesterase